MLVYKLAVKLCHAGGGFIFNDRREISSVEIAKKLEYAIEALNLRYK